MKQMNEEEGYEQLRRVGFTEGEINRLSQLRQDYRISIPLDHARLQFVRWLVTTGRLTDYYVSEDTSSEQCQAPLDLPRQSLVWRSVRTFVTQDIGNVLARRSKLSEDAS
jgi:hypothetical protein